MGNNSPDNYDLDYKESKKLLDHMAVQELKR